MDDAELASWFASGDVNSVRVVYQAYGRLVYTVALSVLRDTGRAEDATKQTFVQAWRSAGTYEPSRPLAAWLTTIAKRVTIDLVDSDSADRGSLPMRPSADKMENVAAVRRALDELPTADRDLIRMQHCDELSHIEIARELQISLGTVKSRTFGAHRRLAALLSHVRAEPGDRTRPALEGGPDG